MYGAEVWQIPTREMNKILSTEMDVLRRSARKSSIERIRNEYKGKSTYFISKAKVHDTKFPIIRHTRSSFCKNSESGICHDNPA